MFLAVKEMKHSKLRYGLVIATIMLISYLIFVLTALAFGLAQSNRLAVDGWQAKAIIVVTHDTRLERYADRLYGITDGRLRKLGHGFERPEQAAGHGSGESGSVV